MLSYFLLGMTLALSQVKPGATPVPAGQPPQTVAPGTPVNITVTQAPPAAPVVTITLYERHGHVTPIRQGFNHTGGGNIDVTQSSPDTVVITMSGVAVAGKHPCRTSLASLDFDLLQSFEVVFEKPDVKAAKLSIEGRVIGLLRSHCRGGGSAEESASCATVSADTVEMATLCVPAHSVAGGENLSINDHAGPISVPVSAGKYTLHQVFRIVAAHPVSLALCKAASAEFAPDPALDPLWISYWEPFHGASKKDFGFQITLRVSPEESKEIGTADRDKATK